MRSAGMESCCNDSDHRATRRHYLHAWGMAYYLIFGKARLDPAKLEGLASRDATSAKHLQKLLGKPLDEIERDWRKAMLESSPSEALELEE